MARTKNFSRARAKLHPSSTLPKTSRPCRQGPSNAQRLSVGPRRSLHLSMARSRRRGGVRLTRASSVNRQQASRQRASRQRASRFPVRANPRRTRPRRGRCRPSPHHEIGRRRGARAGKCRAFTSSGRWSNRVAILTSRGRRRFVWALRRMRQPHAKQLPPGPRLRRRRRAMMLRQGRPFSRLPSLRGPGKGPYPEMTVPLRGARTSPDRSKRTVWRALRPRARALGATKPPNRGDARAKPHWCWSR